MSQICPTPGPAPPLDLPRPWMRPAPGSALPLDPSLPWILPCPWICPTPGSAPPWTYPAPGSAPPLNPPHPWIQNRDVLMDACVGARDTNENTQHLALQMRRVMRSDNLCVHVRLDPKFRALARSKSSGESAAETHSPPCPP